MIRGSQGPSRRVAGDCRIHCEAESALLQRGFCHQVHVFERSPPVTLVEKPLGSRGAHPRHGLLERPPEDCHRSRRPSGHSARGARERLDVPSRCRHRVLFTMGVDLIETRRAFVVSSSMCLASELSSVQRPGSPAPRATLTDGARQNHPMQRMDVVTSGEGHLALRHSFDRLFEQKLRSSTRR